MRRCFEVPQEDELVRRVLLTHGCRIFVDLLSHVDRSSAGCHPSVQGDFVLAVEFSETVSVNTLFFVSADSANDVVGLRPDFGDLVWPDPTEKESLGFVRLSNAVRVERNC